MPIWAQSCLTLWNPMDYKPPGSSAMAFSRQEYWSGLLFSSPGNLPDPRIKPESLALPELTDSLPLHHLKGPDKSEGV